jgi:DNA-binding transcriptional MocR family regulator
MVMETVRSDTKLAQVMGAIRRRIDSRQLTPGARIPSIRAMAETLSVSKATVVEAYERLAAEGVVGSRPGSGFYVAAALAPLRVGEIGRDTDPTVDPLWVMRQSLRRGGAPLRPGCGWLPDDWMPQEALRRAVRALARDGDGPALLNTARRKAPKPCARRWPAGCSTTGSRPARTR